MELQFKKKTCTYVKELIGQCKEQELTDEVRLPDNMPDIGRVLGVWGQVLIRGKEWRPERVGVSGGVMAWILYIPENDTKPQAVECWLPFREQWTIPDTQHDGSILASGHLSFCDARSVSARKLILRTGLCLHVQVLAPSTEDLYTPEDLPNHVQVQVVSRPILLPTEAGEKNFSLEEQLPVPPNDPKVRKLLRYSLLPQIMEQRVSGGRVIFRGTATLHVVAETEEGQLHSFDVEVPFSQYAQLDREYEEGAEATVRLAVTNLELELAENQLLSMKAGLSGQYLIREKTMVDMALDAYSPNYELELSRQSLSLPTVSCEENETITAQRQNLCDGIRVVDVDFLPGVPESRNGDSGMELLLTGRFVILYCDREGQLQNMTVKWEQEHLCGMESQIRAFIAPCGKTTATLSEVSSQFLLEYCCCSSEGMETISMIKVGMEKTAEGDRPAMVVRRAGRESLWEIAKSTGSTVEAIRLLNDIQEEPEPDQMLLIPIS